MITYTFPHLAVVNSRLVYTRDKANQDEPAQDTLHLLHEHCRGGKEEGHPWKVELLQLGLLKSEPTFKTDL